MKRTFLSAFKQATVREPVGNDHYEGTGSSTKEETPAVIKSLKMEETPSGWIRGYQKKKTSREGSPQQPQQSQRQKKTPR